METKENGRGRYMIMNKYSSVPGMLNAYLVKRLSSFDREKPLLLPTLAKLHQKI